MHVFGVALCVRIPRSQGRDLISLSQPTFPHVISLSHLPDLRPRQQSREALSEVSRTFSIYQVEKSGARQRDSKEISPGIPGLHQSYVMALWKAWGWEAQQEGIPKHRKPVWGWRTKENSAATQKASSWSPAARDIPWFGQLVAGLIITEILVFFWGQFPSPAEEKVLICPSKHVKSVRTESK